MPTRIESELRAVQNSITYCKKELEKHKDNEIIKEKITHYLNGLKDHEKLLLKEINGDE